jgi:hypothetical protein
MRAQVRNPPVILQEVTMSKKDYELIAKGIAVHNQDYSIDHVAVWFADRLGVHNALFDKKRFLMSCLCSELTILAQSR